MGSRAVVFVAGGGWFESHYVKSKIICIFFLSHLKDCGYINKKVTNNPPKKLSFVAFMFKPLIAIVWAVLLVEQLVCNYGSIPSR